MIAAFFIVYMLMLSYIAPLASAEQAEAVLEVQLPHLDVRAEYKPGLIAEPKISRPAFIEPGGSFQVVFSKPMQVEKILIDNGYGAAYECEFSQVGGTVFTAKIPDNAEPGLYDLIVYAKEGVYGEPHAVYVGSKDVFSKLNIIHITDRHFGVINSNGRKASNYDLAVNLAVLGLPNNTIIVDSGDIADTAKDGEYRESLFVDTLLDKPLVGVPGNHDHVGGSENYKDYRGPFNFTLDIFGLYRIVGIDSGGDGFITKSQAMWAKTVLTTAEEPIKIVIFHHPHFTHMFGDIPYQFNVTTSEDLFKLLTSKKPNSKYTYIYSSWLANKEALKILVDGIFSAKGNAVLVFSGHIHLDSYAVVIRPDGSRIHYIVTTATGGSVRPGDYHGFRLVTVEPIGKVEMYGDGDYWTRHASFNADEIYASYVKTANAVTATLRIENTGIIDYMEKTVVALHAPSEWLGKTVKLYLKGLDSYKLRCTPLGCTLYAYSNEKPQKGFEYQATLFTKPDNKPPTLELAKMTPTIPRQGRQVVLSFKVSDDSWGIKELYAKIEYDGKEITIKPMLAGDMARIVIPPLKTSKVKITVVAVDTSGKETTFTRIIEYKAAQTKTTTTAPTAVMTQQIQQATTTATTATATRTTTTVETTKPEISLTLKLPKLAEETPTPAKIVKASDNTTLIVAALVVAALAAFALIITRR